MANFCAPKLVFLLLFVIQWTKEPIEVFGEKEETTILSHNDDSSSSSSSPPSSSSSSSFIQLAEDCGSGQFYYLSRCRNCSDIIHMFQSYQEWLGREVNDANNRHKTLSTLSTTTNEGQEKSNYVNNLPIRNNNNNNNNNNRPGPRFGADEDVLSRLINVDPQDQEFIDSSLGSGFIESADPIADIVVKMTKQTQKLVNRFIQSKFIGNELLSAIDQCRQYQNVSACQMWSNLCVMTMYSYSDIPTSQHSSSSMSLNSYDSKANSHELEESTNHLTTTTTKKSLSWQQCKQFTVNSICDSLRDWYRVERKSSLDILNIYALDEPLTKPGSGLSVRLNQAIHLLAYKYSYDGKLIGIDQFGLGDIEKFCVISDHLRVYNSDSSHVRLGKNMQLKCQFDQIQANLAAIKHFNETIFIDLYIGYPLNGATFVKPVPVLIKNLLYNGIQINRKHAKDPSRWKLVHRFFFHTTVALDGEQNDDYSRQRNNKLEEVIVYTKNVVLDFKFRRQERGALLSSILLTLDYGQLSRPNHVERNISSTLNTSSTIFETNVSILQTLVDMQSYKKDLDLVVTILSILSSIWSLIKCYNIQKCYGIVKLDLDSLIKFIIIGCDTVANLLATVTLLFLTFLFISLKFQSTVQIMAPNEELESALVVNLQLAFAFKLIGLTHKIYIQLCADIFFIDWEKPKMLTSGQILNHLSHYGQTKDQNKDALNSGNSDIRYPITNSQQSSFWRSYTIINRWLQMQTLRRQDITLQLLLFVCIVDISQVTNLATADPNLDLTWANNHSHNRLAPCTSVTFRLLILSFVYLTISMSQILFKKYFYEPLVKNTVNEFVDLCSVANVSLFCMLYPRFGYYIHGRNANGSGDCGIAEVNALLEREERDLCSKRGLAPNSDQQTFVLILPRIINDHYRKLLDREDLANTSRVGKQETSNVGQFEQNKFIGKNWLKSALNFSLASTSSFSSNRTFIEAIVARNKAINVFLTNFLEHIYKDIDYLIRERRRFESFLLDVDFDDESSAARNGPLSASLDKSTAAIFCKDHNDSFTSLFWLGLELDLILVELFSLLIFDLWLGQSLVITISLVWLLHHTFKAIYLSCARRNLVTKAMVDEKFLFK